MQFPKLSRSFVKRTTRDFMLLFIILQIVLFFEHGRRRAVGLVVDGMQSIKSFSDFLELLYEYDIMAIGFSLIIALAINLVFEKMIIFWNHVCQNKDEKTNRSLQK